MPWLLALAGLAMPLLGSGYVAWPIALVWLLVLALIRLVGGALVPTRSHRIATAILVLPVLVLFGTLGGWWLIPADLAWLALSVADRDRPRAPTGDPGPGQIPMR